jgi:hypothetical protein
MPITDALHTATALEQAGLPKIAAVLIAEKREESALAIAETAQDRLRVELTQFRSEIRSDLATIRVELASQRADFDRSLRSLQTVILSAVGLAATVGLAVGGAIITILLRH